MAKRTLLELVQNIMSALDSDKVDSVLDTVESEQVVDVLRDTYEQMIANQLIPEINTLTRFDTVDLIDFPGSLNYLAIPETVSHVIFFKYDIQADGDTSSNYRELTYLPPSNFLKQAYLIQDDDVNAIQVTDPGLSSVTYYVKKDTAPRFYTSFDDQYIALDSFDMVVDPIQALGTKTVVMAKMVPTWTVDDAFVPQMDENLFPYLLAEAKSTCFVNLKQQGNPKVDKQSREQRNRIQGHKFRTEAAQRKSTGNTGPNFGRC